MAFDTPSTLRWISADFFTSSYRIVGKLSVPGSGLMGVMNDQMTSFMEIQDARLARLHMPTKLVEHYELVRLVRSQVFAICLARREDLGPAGMARGGYNRINEFSVHISTQVYELTGKVEWPGRFEFSAIMVEGHREFVPIYDAHLTAILIPALKVDAPAMLINRSHVDLLGLKSQLVED
jgi:hypothetical protein